MATTTHRSTPDSGPAPKARIPDLPSTLLTIREHLGLTRADAHERHRVSSSYLSQIEDGKRTPSLDLLEQIIAGYELSCAQAQYLRELRAPARRLSPISHLRRFIARTPQLVQHLDKLEQHGVPATFIDPLKQVLAANNALRTALPGMFDIGCIPEWMFSATGRAAVLNWPAEALYTVASLRPGLARYRDSPRARALLADLAKDPTFNEIWHNNIDIIYGRDTSNPLQCHHPDTDNHYSLTLAISPVTQTQEILLATAVPGPPANLSTSLEHG
ncbi:helix-turn-helix domain-containing protein [Nocardia sp. NPDC002869]|uniref:MmyB family transcriptional regulator n=1 Tax=Nocardia sp. NPDC002869 TaxID=3161032 RepID=UPI00398CEF78